MTSDIEKRFREDAFEAYRLAKKEYGYTARYFHEMLAEHGAVQTARILLAKRPSDGFTKLWELGRLDLTIEARMLRPEYAILFTAAELEKARKRLAEYGYKGNQQ